MEAAAAAAAVPHRHRPVHSSVYHQRPSYLRPIYLLSFRAPPPRLSSSSSTKSSLSIRASSSSSSSSFSDSLYPNPKSPKPQLTETLKPIPVSILKTAVAAAVAATAVFFAQFNLKANVATAISPPPVVETGNKETVSGEENERDLEEYLSSHPEDVQALRNLMEAKIKNRKVDEAIGIVEQLIRLEPEDIEWPLMKAHLHIYNGELEVAKVGFNEIIEKDPAKVEAYHGLVMAASQADSGRELKEIEKRVGEAMEVCKREKRKGDLRDFKLLIAQIRVIEGNYDAALRVYQELVKEEPRDFRPYLCQGIIYTLLRKNDEAEKQFEKYRRLVPKGHPYAQYFDDNMIATKVFGQKVENERASSKS
ncbi:protein SLOW GREEN 1, chloroplastic-like [Diospyros lotus]|uniref:protein SLOW GREEN 1, chloroplastic-like n=1 Tax=Diospyros lotus TaxID=55363 RepID=UPI002253B669|nr:protein SLOW GREEN 1, chloroplastic-like [Diospyros lotus]